MSASESPGRVEVSDLGAVPESSGLCTHEFIEIPKPTALSFSHTYPCPACGGQAEFWRFQLVGDNVRLDLCEHEAGSTALVRNRILWNVRDEDIDEIVITEPHLVHIEQMNSRVWWIAIYLDDSDGPYWMGNFVCDSRGHMRFTEQENNDVEWDRDDSHEESLPVLDGMPTVDDLIGSDPDFETHEMRHDAEVERLRDVVAATREHLDACARGDDPARTAAAYRRLDAAVRLLDSGEEG